MTRSFVARSLLSALAALLLLTPTAFGFGQLGGVNMAGGGPDAANFQLDGPKDIVRSGDGTFYVLDVGNYRVLHIDAQGELIDAFGGPGSADQNTASPTAIALSGPGATPDVLVAAGSGLIKRFHSDGSYAWKFGSTYGSGDGQFGSVGGMVVDPLCGELFVSDSNGGGSAKYRVQRIAIKDNPDTIAVEVPGQHLETIGLGTGVPDSGVNGKLWNPKGMAFSPDGARLFVADSSNYRVQAFKASGNCAARSFAYEARLGSSLGSAPDYTLNPVAVAVDTSLFPSPARIYVSLGYTDSLVKMFSATSAAAGEASPPFSIPAEGRKWGSVWPSLSDVTDGPDDLGAPAGIVVDGSNAWIAEMANNRIHRYSGISDASPFQAPTSLAAWGRSALKDGFFRSVTSVDAAPDGSFYGFDSSKLRIQHFSARGALLGAFGEYGSGGADGTFGFGVGSIAVAPDGKVLVADPDNHRIQRFGADGQHIGNLTWSPLTAGEIGPSLIDVDGAGNIWVYDGYEQKVIKIAPSGTVLASMGKSGFDPNDDSIYSPTDLAVSPDGLSVYVADGGVNRIKKFTSADGVNYAATTVSSTDSSGGTGDGQFKYPSAIDVDPISGGLAVADSNNNRVQRLRADLSFDSKFGSPGFGAENLTSPMGVAFDRWGNLWVSDNGNDSVKRYGDPPTVKIASPLGGATTSDASIVVTYEVTDPGSDCSIASGAAVVLSAGANTLTVTCTNAQGTGAASVVVTRTASRPVLLLAKKLKLARRLKISATCASGCILSPKLQLGGKSLRIKGVTLTPAASRRNVTVSLSASQLAKAKKALAARRRVQLVVSATVADTSGAVVAKSTLKR